jgi:hypothetical protein
MSDWKQDKKHCPGQSAPSETISLALALHSSRDRQKISALSVNAATRI